MERILFPDLCGSPARIGPAPSLQEKSRSSRASRYDDLLMRLLVRLADNRNLLKNLVLRDLKHRYVGSLGGFMWSVVQPVVQLLTYWFAYWVGILGKPGTNYDNVPIPVF